MRRQDETNEFKVTFSSLLFFFLFSYLTSKTQKGSVFVEFDSPETAKTFLSLDPKPQWKDSDLIVYSKEDYCEMKIKEKGLTGRAADFRRKGILGNPLGRKSFNAFREMNTKDGKGKGTIKDAKKEKPEVWLDFMGKRVRVYDEDGKGCIREDEYETVPKATLKVGGLKGDCQWTDIKVRLFSLLCYV
jgi:lupus La protein